MKKFCLVGIDRDGTINEDRGYFGKEDDWKEQLIIYPHVIEVLTALKSDPRFKIVVASNQAGVARGYFDVTRVEEINREIAGRLGLKGAVLDGWYSCYFIDKKYAREKGISLDSPWVKETDVETGLNAKGKGILINRDEEERDKVKKMLKNKEYSGRIFIVDNFFEAAEIILKDNKLSL